MRKMLLLPLAVLLAMAIAAPPASALTLTIGDYQATFWDRSNLYYDDDQNAATPMVPRPLSGQLADEGDENRATFNAGTIKLLSTDTVVWQTGPGEELTGILYDLELATVNAVGLAMDLDFVPLGRNPVPGAPATFGGVLEIYLDNTPDYSTDPGGVGLLDALLPVAPPIAIPDVAPTSPWPGNLGDGGPRFWGEGQLPVGPQAPRDSFPSATDGGLWLQAVFVDFATAGIPGHAVGTVFEESLDLTTGVGSASAFGYITGGSAAPSFVKNSYGPFMDVAISMDLRTPRMDLDPLLPDGAANPDFGKLVDVPNYSGFGYWQVDSTGDAQFAVIPEPATMGLLGMSLLAGFGLRRRKKEKI